MFRAPSLSSRTNDLIPGLAGLDRELAAYHLDEGYLVVGPSGVFVVVDAGAATEPACRRAAALAEQVRADLADRLAWVPFVDAVVVSTESSYDPAQPALVIPPDLVHFTVAEGRRVVDTPTLAHLHLLPLPRVQPRP